MRFMIKKSRSTKGTLEMKAEGNMKKGYPKLRAYLAANNIKQKEVADLISVTESTFSKKINGIADFDMNEVRIICKHYGLKADIFMP